MNALTITVKPLATNQGVWQNGNFLYFYVGWSQPSQEEMVYGVVRFHKDNRNSEVYKKMVSEAINSEQRSLLIVGGALFTYEAKDKQGNSKSFVGINLNPFHGSSMLLVDSGLSDNTNQLYWAGWVSEVKAFESYDGSKKPFVYINAPCKMFDTEEKKDVTTWLRIKSWDAYDVKVFKDAQKGSRAWAHGRMSVQYYTPNEGPNAGQERMNAEVLVSQAGLFQSRGGGGGSYQENALPNDDEVRNMANIPF